MKIADLIPDYEKKYFYCLSDDPHEWIAGARRKEKWYRLI